MFLIPKCQKYIFIYAHISFFYPSLYILINHFRSYTKILTMIPLISNPNSPHSYLIHRIPTSISHTLTLILRIPIFLIPVFTDSQKEMIILSPHKTY